jgi:hypothetical protein
MSSKLKLTCSFVYTDECLVCEHKLDCFPEDGYNPKTQDCICNDICYNCKTYKGHCYIGNSEEFAWLDDE